MDASEPPTVLSIPNHVSIEKKSVEPIMSANNAGLKITETKGPGQHPNPSKPTEVIAQLGEKTLTDSFEKLALSGRGDPSSDEEQKSEPPASINAQSDVERKIAGDKAEQRPVQNGVGSTPTVQLLSRSRGSTPPHSETSDSFSPAILVNNQEPFIHQLQHMLVDPVDEPDPRLMDALENHRDRLFVIKLEKDLIGFINDKACEVFDMPPINSYHRLLAHKMAEYYRLTHVVDASGASVRMFRGQAARIPPTRLSDFPVASQQQQKPALGTAKPAVKIMRRSPSDKGNGSPRHSTTPSKAGSEASSDHGDPSSSAKTTREEREAAYQEARARIFKDFVESPPDTPPPGKQEKPKRQEKPDDFSGRSQFYPVMPPQVHTPQQYYPQAYPEPSLQMMTSQVGPGRFNPMTPNFTPQSGYAPPGAQSFVPPPAGNRPFIPYLNGNDRGYTSQQQQFPQPIYPNRNGMFAGQLQPTPNGNYSTARSQQTSMQSSYSSGGFSPPNGFLQQPQQSVINPQMNPSMNRSQPQPQYPISQQFGNPQSLSGQRPSFGWNNNIPTPGAVSMFPRSSSAPGNPGAMDGNAPMMNIYGIPATPGWGQTNWNGMGRGAMGGMNMRM